MVISEEVAQIHLNPGAIHISEEPALISTLLGSCVAVTMFSPRLKAGAMCHGLLPACKGEKPCRCEKHCRAGVRYVGCSIRRMLEWFVQQGVGRGEIDVKVFGGADMFGGRENSATVSVGEQNIVMAFQVLEEERLRISASDVGGAKGRKIFFHTATGEVLLKRLHKSDNER